MDGLARLRSDLCLVYINEGKRTFSCEMALRNKKTFLNHPTILYFTEYFPDSTVIYYAPKTLIKWSD